MRGQDPGSEHERVSETPASPTPPKSFGRPWDAGQADTPPWGMSDPAPQSWQPPPAFTAAAAGMPVWRGPSGPAPAWPAATGEPIGEPWPGNSPATPGTVVPGPATTAAAQEAASRENGAAPGTPYPGPGAPAGGPTPPNGIAGEPRFFLPDPATGLPPFPGGAAAPAQGTPPAQQSPAWPPGQYPGAPAGQDGAYPQPPGALPGPTPYAGAATGYAVPTPAPGALPGPMPYAVAPGGGHPGYPQPPGALPGPMPYAAPTAQDAQPPAPAAPGEPAADPAPYADPTGAENPAAQGTGGAPAADWAPSATAANPADPAWTPGPAWAAAAEGNAGEAGDGASADAAASAAGTADAAAAPAEGTTRTVALRRAVDIPVWPPGGAPADGGATPPAGDAPGAEAAPEAQPATGEAAAPEQGDPAAAQAPAAAPEVPWRPSLTSAEENPAAQAQPQAASADPAAVAAPPTTPARPAAADVPQPVPPPATPQRPTVANPILASPTQPGPGFAPPAGTPGPATVAGPFVGFGRPLPSGTGGGSSAFTPFQGGFRQPSADPAPATPATRGPMGKKLLVGAMIVAAIGTIGVGAYLAYQGLGDSSQAAAHGKVPSVVTPPQDQTPAQAIDSERTDPKEMTPGEAFPAKKVSIAGHTFRRVQVDTTARCERGASGRFAEALRDNKCAKLLRATYVDAKRRYAVTTGIAVMPDKAAAVKVDGAKDLANNVWFRGLAGPSGSGGERVDISGGYAAGLVWGRYIVFSYATYSDGHTPKENEKDLGPISDAFRQHTAKVIEKRANGG